jgi:hypothetical protein
LTVGLLALGACSKSAKPTAEARLAPTESAPMTEGTGAAAKDTSRAAAPAVAANMLLKTSRRVIRNAELSIEVTSPAAAEATVTELVERLGGFLASSEREVVGEEGQRAETRLRLSLRVPSEKLGQALGEIKRLGHGAETEKIGSEDVTEEYIDVAARIKNQRSLEEQLTRLMAQANTVESALKVHQELAGVRTEIDRLEGRKRFLETESDLAKISLSLNPLRPIVAATPNGFGVAFRRAATDAVDISASLLTFAIRSLGVLAPILVMLGAPGWLIALWIQRRQRRSAHATIETSGPASTAM